MFAACRLEPALSPRHRVALRELARHEEQLAEELDRRAEAQSSIVRHRAAIRRLTRQCQKLSSTS